MGVSTYGDLPGVQAVIRGGAITQINVGYEQICVLFGRADLASGTASANEYKEIQTSVDASTYFGDGSKLAEGLQEALRNGANRKYLYGVAPTETTVAAEPIAGGSGTLANAPIVEDLSTITVTNVTPATPVEETPVFRYESVPDASSLASDEVAINPNTGEVAAGDADNYEIDYSYLDWASALNAADPVVRHNETGVYATLKDAEVVSQLLADKVDKLRPTYKLVRGVGGAQPNATNARGEGIINATEYSDTIDNDAVFLAGPVRLADDATGKTLLGGVAGLMAGNSLSNAIYGDVVKGYGALVQQLSNAEEGDPITKDQDVGTGLRGEQVMPVRDDARDGRGGITLEDSLSTSTATDWKRDYHRRRIVDQVLIATREIGEAVSGKHMEDARLEDAEQQIVDVLEQFARDGLLETNMDNGSFDSGAGSGGSAATDEDRTYTAQVTRTDTDTIAVEVSFIPIGVVKNIEETLIVSETQANQSA